MYDIDFYHDLPIKPTNRIFGVRINVWSSACQFSKSSQKIEYFSYIGQFHSSKRKQVMTIWMLMIFAFLGYFYHFHLTVPFSRQDSKTLVTKSFVTNSFFTCHPPLRKTHKKKTLKAYAVFSREFLDLISNRFLIIFPIRRKTLKFPLVSAVGWTPSNWSTVFTNGVLSHKIFFIISRFFRQFCRLAHRILCVTPWF